MERYDIQGVSPTRQGQSGQVVAPKWHGRGTRMKSLNRPVTSWHGSLSAPRWIFFFLPLDATHAGSWSLWASMVKRFFFFEATEWWWAIGIFWWPASFFFWHLLGPYWGSTLGLPTPGDKPTWGSGAFMALDPAEWLTVQEWLSHPAT